MAARRTPWMAELVARRLPALRRSNRTRELAAALLARDDLAVGLRRVVVDYTDDLRRALAGPARDRRREPAVGGLTPAAADCATWPAARHDRRAWRRTSGGSASWAAPSTRSTMDTWSRPARWPSRFLLDEVVFVPTGQPWQKAANEVTRPRTAT